METSNRRHSFVMLPKGRRFQLRCRGLAVAVSEFTCIVHTRGSRRTQMVLAAATSPPPLPAPTVGSTPTKCVSWVTRLFILCNSWLVIWSPTWTRRRRTKPMVWSCGDMMSALRGVQWRNGFPCIPGRADGALWSPLLHVSLHLYLTSSAESRKRKKCALHQAVGPVDSMLQCRDQP